MRFRNWLITEDGDDSGSDWFYGNSVYPTDAGDWAYDYPYPSDFALLQSRWKQERDLWGRKFHGLDPQSTIKSKFTSVYSNTMPDTSESGWKHNPKERPNLTIDKNAKLELHAFRKKADIGSVVNKTNDLIDKTDDLNRIFGKFEPSRHELATNFDEPWSPYSGSVEMRYAKKKKYGKGQNNF